MSYYTMLLEALYRQVELSKWSLERLHSKAKTSVTAGTAALSVVTVGLSGFAVLLARADLDHMALLESLFGKYATCMIGVAIAGIVAIIVSLLLSIAALKSHGVHQILTSEEFEEASGKAGKPTETEAYLGPRLLRNIHASVKTFEEYNVKIAPMVRWGQWLLLAGIGLISMVPLAALLRLLVS